MDISEKLYIEIKGSRKIPFAAGFTAKIIKRISLSTFFKIRVNWLVILSYRFNSLNNNITPVICILAAKRRE